MLLVQRGRLKLTDQAFPLLDLTMPFGEKSPLDSRLNSITVHQLLCHTGGWSRDLGRNPYETWTGFDPMFYPVQIAKASALVVLMQTGGHGSDQFVSYRNLPHLLDSIVGDAANEIMFITFDGRVQQTWHFPTRTDGLEYAMSHPMRRFPLTLTA